MMVVPARTQEDRLLAVALSHLEAEDIAVEAERLIDVRDLQMDVSDVHARVDRLGHAPSLRAGARQALPPALRPTAPRAANRSSPRNRERRGRRAVPSCGRT